MKKPHIKHAYGIIAWAAGLIFAILWGIHLLLPHVVNIPGVRNRIMGLAANAISADVRFGEIAPALLPAPRIVVNRVDITAPNNAAVEVRQLIIYPKVWQLLIGELKIDRLKLVEPHGVVSWPLPGAGPPRALKSTLMDPKGMIPKKLADGVARGVDVLGRFSAEIVGGRLSVQNNGRIDRLLSNVQSKLAADGGRLLIKIQENSSLATRFRLEVAIDPQTLVSKGRVTIAGLHTERIKALGYGLNGGHFPQMVIDLDVDFESEGPEAFQARYAVRADKMTLINGQRQLGVDDLMIDGQVHWTPQHSEIKVSHLKSASIGGTLDGSLKWSETPPVTELPFEIRFNGADLNLFQIRDGLEQLYGDHSVIQRVLDIVRGGTVPSLSGRMRATHWSGKKLMEQFHVACDLEDGRIMVPPNELLDLEDVAGRVVIADGRLSAHNLTARFGNTSAKNGTLVLGLYDKSRAFKLDTLIDADLAQLPGVLKKLIKSKSHLVHLDQLPPITGRASGRLVLGDRLDRITAQITAASHIQTSDSAFDAVGTIDHLPGPLTTARLFLQGELGSGVVAWLWRTASIPPEFLLATPFTLDRANISWHPPGVLTLMGDLEREGGFRAEAALTAKKNDFHLQRLYLHEGASDAEVSFRRRNKGELLDAGFQGYLEKSVVDKLFLNNKLLGGWINGHFKAHLDLVEPERTNVHGPLSIRNVDIPLGGSPPIRIVKGSVIGLNTMFTVPSMSLVWGDQSVTLSGKGLYFQDALDLDLSLHTDRLNAKKLTPLFNALKPDSSERSAQANTKIPIRGKAVVQIDQLDYHRYRIAPFHAAVDHTEEQTLIDIADADVCGIQLPGHIRLSGGAVSMELQPRVLGTGLKDASSCLLDLQHTERLEGTVDLSGRLTTNGKTNAELVSNLRGKVDLHIEKGRIYNVGSAGLFTNLLSFLSINQYVTGDLPDLTRNDFQYNRIDSQLVFHDGLIQIKEGIVKSNSVNMVADGQYHMLSKDLDLEMLVSPLTTVDWIIERIPIIGNILGGTLVAIPVSVKGHQSDPKITPLALSAVGSRLGGILERTLKTPVRIIEPLLKDDESKQAQE